MLKDRAARYACLPVLAVLLTSGCAFEVGAAGLRVDQRVSFSAPRPYAEVQVPVSVSWRDSRLAGAGHYGVFVDQSPVSPGRPLTAVADSDRTCNPKAGCPDRAYLDSHQVFETHSTAFTLEQLQATASDPGAVQLHSLTVVLLDRRGRRVGESSWTLPFTIRSPRT